MQYSDKDFVRVLKDVIETYYIPALETSIENKLTKELDNRIEAEVKKIYQQQVVQTNEDLAVALTEVIGLLAMRKINGEA